MITFNRPQALIIAKLASYFKIAKRELRADAFHSSGTDDSLVHSAIMSELGFNYQLRCIDGACFKFKHILGWAKFERSALYQEFLLGEGMLAPNETSRYLMAFYASGTAWVMRRSRGLGYQGVGGWHLRPNDSQQGFIVEPLTNYLLVKCPRVEDE